MRSKVCHVTSMHSIDDTRVFHNECKSLTKRYEVYLVAPNVKDQVVNNVNIRGVELSTKRFQRLCQLHRLVPILKDIDATVYHFHDPELISVGLRVRRWGKKVIFDSHEDVPAQQSEKASLPPLLRKLLANAYALYEKQNLRKYDALVTVTPSIVDRLKLTNPHTYQVTNYPSFIDYKDERKWNKTIVFAGGISSQWMHTNILRSIENLDVRYDLAGFANNEYLDKLKSMPAWGKVDYKGRLKFTEIPALLQSSMAGMALNDYVANVGYKLGSLGNTKLFEYMMAGIPVIATDFILWRQIVEKYDCGICVNPHDVSAITNAIDYFINNPEVAKQKGDNGRKAVKEKYCWATQEPILFEMYDYVISK